MQAPMRSRPVMLSVAMFLVAAGSVKVLFMCRCFSVFFLPICMTKVKRHPTLEQDSKHGFVARWIFPDFFGFISQNIDYQYFMPFIFEGKFTFFA